MLGIPVTLILVFHYQLSNTGIWVGPTLACAFNTFAYLYLFKKENWGDLIRKSVEQRQKDKLKKIHDA